MVAWIISVDRRRGSPETVRAELDSISESVPALNVVMLSDALENSPDAGKFRDFAPFARVESLDERVLAWTLEELVAEFGWQIDVTRPKPKGSDQ